MRISDLMNCLVIRRNDSQGVVLSSRESMAINSRSILRCGLSDVSY